MERKKSLFSARSLGLCLLMPALLLSGCTGGSDSAGSGNDAASANSPTASGTPAESDKPLDFSKYNAYLDVLNNVYEMDGLLTDYFTVVQYQPEFALIEGMDYSMLDDTFSFYTFQDYPMELAMDYSESEPDYPEQDKLLMELNEPYCAMGEILGDLASYISFKNYEDDALAKAAQLHTQLYNAVSAFDDAAWPFADAMDVLDNATEQDELDRLKSEGWDIAYYSRVIINLSDDIDAEVWAQVAESESLPVLDMTNLESLYTQYQQAYAALTEALDDPEQVTDQWPKESLRDAQKDSYTSAVNNVDLALGDFMTAARNQEDYSQSYDSYSSAISTLVDRYNSSISG